MRFTALAMATAIALLGLTACNEQVTGPTTAEFDKEREALMARLQNKKDRKASPKAEKASKPASAPKDASFASVDDGFKYDPTGKRDPFRSFEWDRKDRQTADDAVGPLERFDLAQLSLVAVVWNTGGARALVQDPSGQGYIIGTGARIGKNDGRVTMINDNLVVVKETYVDFLGQETTKDIEMRIRRSQGG